MSDMRDTRSASNIPVNHILKDGKVLKNIGGYKIPKSHPVYQTMKRVRGYDR